MVKTRIEVFPDIAGHIDFFEEMPEYDISMYTHKKMKTNSENSLKVLQDVLPILEAQEHFDNDSLYEVLSKYVADAGVKTGFVMWPIRTALSGKQMTPLKRHGNHGGAGKRGVLKENPFGNREAVQWRSVRLRRGPSAMEKDRL